MLRSKMIFYPGNCYQQMQSRTHVIATKTSEVLKASEVCLMPTECNLGVFPVMTGNNGDGSGRAVGTDRLEEVGAQVAVAAVGDDHHSCRSPVPPPGGHGSAAGHAAEDAFVGCQQAGGPFAFHRHLCQRKSESASRMISATKIYRM